MIYVVGPQTSLVVVFFFFFSFFFFSLFLSLRVFFIVGSLRGTVVTTTVRHVPSVLAEGNRHVLPVLAERNDLYAFGGKKTQSL